MARFSSTGGQRERPVADGMVWIDFELIFKIKMKLVGRLFDEPLAVDFITKPSSSSPPRKDFFWPAFVANTDDPPVTKIRLWASFGVQSQLESGPFEKKIF